MSLSSSISQTITKTLLSKLPSELASKFSLNEDEVKAYLSEFLTNQLGKSKAKAKNHTGRTSGFILFSNAHRAATVQSLTADGTFDGKDNKTKLGLTGKSLGSQWNSLSDTDKLEWNNRAKEANSARAAGIAAPAPAPVAQAVPAAAPAQAPAAPKGVKVVKKVQPAAAPSAVTEPKKVKKVQQVKKAN